MVYAYRAGMDALRGRTVCRMRRSEYQKRGPDHTHINEIFERCGLPHLPDPIPMLTDTAAATRSTSPASFSALRPNGNAATVTCRSVSRYCLKADVQCRLPAETNASHYHQSNHVAHATAELVRPYPLGSIRHGPALPPYLRGQSLEETRNNLTAHFWTSTRYSNKTQEDTTVECQGTFMERVRRIKGICNLASQRKSATCFAQGRSRSATPSQKR